MPRRPRSILPAAGEHQHVLSETRICQNFSLPLPYSHQAPKSTYTEHEAMVEWFGLKQGLI